MKIILFPWAKKLRNDGQNPKNFPYWPDVIKQLTELGHTVIQVGVEGEIQLVEDFRKNLPLSQLIELMKSADTWIGIDSFGQHLGWHLGIKGIAIFGQSDPEIFGHVENINILKSREYLRQNQFWWWEQAEYKQDAFVSSNEVIKIFKENFK